MAKLTPAEKRAKNEARYAAMPSGIRFWQRGALGWDGCEAEDAEFMTVGGSLDALVEFVERGGLATVGYLKSRR